MSLSEEFVILDAVVRINQKVRIVNERQLSGNLTFMVGMDSWEENSPLKGFGLQVVVFIVAVLMFEVEKQELLAQAVDSVSQLVEEVWLVPSSFLCV